MQDLLLGENKKTDFCELQNKIEIEHVFELSKTCLYCYDAPCVQACPTEIRIPEFIRSLQSGNNKGAGLEILRANPLGGTCARVCPVESLCEKACVKNKMDEPAVEIGRLQRYAVDEYMKIKDRTDFPRASSKGKRIAVVGSGPAGLGCAFFLSQKGYEVEIFDAKEKAGGLNEYGIAAYKMTDNWAQVEVDFILSTGGISINKEKTLGLDFDIQSLLKEFSAVFLGIGLSGAKRLELVGEHFKNVMSAVDLIAKIRQQQVLSSMFNSKRIAVIGGGSTAIDIACQSVLLGASDITIFYHREKKQMRATLKECQQAEKLGVCIRANLNLKKINSESSGSELCLEFDKAIDSKIVKTFETVDYVFKAVGQKLFREDEDYSIIGPANIEIKYGKIVVNKNRETSLEGVYAGGDCIGISEDLTVSAVQDGKIAAASIHKYLQDLP